MQIKMLLKLLVLGGISILMLIALGSVGGVAEERRGRLHAVEQNIADSYAGPQKIIGPFIKVEFRESWTERMYNEAKDTWYDSPHQEVHTRLVYPERLDYEGSMTVKERYRGIFKAHVFQSAGKVSGEIIVPPLDTFRVKADASREMLSAGICLLIRDPRGISEVPELLWNNSSLKLESGGGLKKKSSGIHAPLSLEDLFDQTVTFSMDLNVHGMGELKFVPLGSENRVKLKSTWPHPSFIGDFLATTYDITDEGFEAEWNINGLASTAQADMNNYPSQVQSFGVKLIDPVNPYPLTDRALKYGFLFVFITFAAFFLFELVRKLKIHPIQYSFVGLAQAIFFLLLLSLSEHIGFGLSYLIAAAATIGVITCYLFSVLKGVKRGLLFGGILSVLYGALYGLLQSEDHALVAGSTLLFVLMALVMILTRKVDWYALSAKKEGGAVCG